MSTQIIFKYDGIQNTSKEFTQEAMDRYTDIISKVMNHEKGSDNYYIAFCKNEAIYSPQEFYFVMLGMSRVLFRFTVFCDAFKISQDDYSMKIVTLKKDSIISDHISNTQTAIKRLTKEGVKYYNSIKDKPYAQDEYKKLFFSPEYSTNVTLWHEIGLAKGGD